MKNKILIFIIGLLVGAIIATAGFLIYNKVVKNNLMTEPEEMMQMNGNGQMMQPSNDNMEEPPEKPSGDNGEEVPTKPEDLNNNTNS